MSCGGTGIVYVCANDCTCDDRMDCPGCEDCRCPECEGEHWWCMLCEDWIHPQNVGYEEVHAIDGCRGECVPFNPDCPTCEGTGRKP